MTQLDVAKLKSRVSKCLNAAIIILRNAVQVILEESLI